jgi:lipid-A-disaccharide synthase-like uncharacterized protein
MPPPAADITVVWVSYFSTAYLEKLHANLHAKASGTTAIRFLLIDNSHGKDAAIQAFSEARSDVDLHIPPAHGLVGSWGHAAGLDVAMPLLNTTYTLICDPDIHVFKAGWDRFLIDLLHHEKAASVGIPYPFWRVGVYHHFPCPIFHFFHTETILALGQTWTPFATNRLRNAYNFVGRQVVRLGGLATRKTLTRSAGMRAVTGWLEKRFGMVGPDTGYRWCNAADREGLSRIMFEVVAAHHPDYAERIGLPGFQELADQWELFYYGDEPILTHKYGTQSRMWRTPAATRVDYWYEQIALFEQALSHE